MKVNEYYTADWHLGHKNILKFCPDRAPNLEAMHRKLIKRYNSCVGPNDVCWFLGDVGMASSELLKSILSQLNGKKISVLGNHDKGVQAMYSIGFDAVMYSAETYIAEQRVTMSHCPIKGLYREDTTGYRAENENWHKETFKGFNRWTIEDRGTFHLHGHIHSPNGGRSEKTLGRQYDVGVDANNMMPVSKSVIESWIVKTMKSEG